MRLPPRWRPLDDAELTGAGRSSADLLGVSASRIAATLAQHLLREITGRGARGGPLAPLAAQLGHDITHLQGRRIEAKLDRLADAVCEGLAGGAAAAFGWQQHLEQVRDIAPVTGLLDRDGEVAELADFCSGPGRYLWWRANAWAGKSALMSWFVLHPPPSTAVVSFFVTKQHASHDDSAAFTYELVRQLEELLRHDRPHRPRGGSSAEAWKLLLRLAARRLEDQGGSLVLVIDGLDEDRSRERGLRTTDYLALHHCCRSIVLMG
jgi:hypothetical protein